MNRLKAQLEEREQAIEAKQATIHEMQLSLERSKVGIPSIICVAIQPQKPDSA